MFKKILTNTLLAVATVLVALLVIRCGGDGGGSTPTRVLEPISYTGVMTPVAVTLDNTPTLVANVIYGGAAAETNIPSAVTITVPLPLPGNGAISTGRLMDLFQPMLDDIFGDATPGYAIPTAEVFNNEVRNCDSGYYILNGSVDDITMLGTVTYDFYNCLDDGVTLDGMVHFTIHDNDFYQFNFTMDFVLVTITSSELNVTMSGKVRSDNSVSGYTLTMRDTMNYVERVKRTDNVDKMYEYENYVKTVVDDYYGGGSVSFRGEPAAIMYDSDYGSYSVETPSALQFSSDYLSYPDLGGQLVMTGDQSAIRLTVESGRHVKLELDLNGDAVYDVLRYVLWSEFENFASLNLTDTDGDGMHDSWESTYGLDLNVDDADADYDLDGLTNLQEYQQGYDPFDGF